MKKYLGPTDLVYLWSKIKAYLSGFVSITESGGVKTLTVGNISVVLYQRPASGIAKSDLASDVQASLNKADSALQSETDPVFAASVASRITSGDVDNWNDKQDAIADLNEIRSNAAAGAAGAAAAIPVTQKGQANGVATLDNTGKVPSSQLPSYVDDVVEAYIRPGETALGSRWLATESASGPVITPEAGKLYIIMNGDATYLTNSEYRWSGTMYAKLNDGGMSEMTTAEMDTATNNWT